MITSSELLSALTRFLSELEDQSDSNLIMNKSFKPICEPNQLEMKSKDLTQKKDSFTNQDFKLWF